MSSIVKLLSELGSDAELQNEYKSNPESVIQRYDVSSDEKDAVLNGDVEKLKSLSKQDNIRMHDSIIKSYK